jgi:TusA-related sulfurtransferase
MGATAVSRTLDLRGCGAPLPIARTAVAMAGMRSGELLEVLTTDRGSLRDLPVWCRATGNRLVEQTKDDGIHRFVIRKR